MTLQIFR